MSRYIGLAAIGLLLVHVAMVHGEVPLPTIYTSQGFGQNLGSIDPTTGSGTNIGSYGLEFPIIAGVSTAFDTDGTIYSFFLDLDSEGLLGGNLGTVDKFTGAATIIGSLERTMLAHEIADDGTMYGVAHVAPDLNLGGEATLYSIDKKTAKSTPIGDTGVLRTMDLAFHRDNLWVVGGADGGNELYTIDLESGAADFKTTITNVRPGDEIMGIMSNDHTLFATAFAADSPLYEINTETGQATVIGGTTFLNPHGGDTPPWLPSGVISSPGLDGKIPPGLGGGLPPQSHQHAVPEPTSVTLLLLACKICTLVRRHTSVQCDQE